MIRRWIKEHREEFVQDMMDFFRIKSVSEPQEGSSPFGEGCKSMLNFALETSRRYGLDTVNHENYCGSALLPGKTSREIGIFSHVDVVEAGGGWTHPPYEPTIKDGWIYARGSSDNKGPAVASLYALRYLKEHNISLKHTVRLYYGCSEEHGMEDIIYYKNHYLLPEFSIVPDAAFAVCYAEKGILEGEFSIAVAGNLVMFEAGHAANAVPGTAMAVLSVQEDACGCLEGFSDISVEKCRDGVSVFAKGTTAHAASPEGADNAAVKLAKALCESGLLDQDTAECISYIWKAFEKADGGLVGGMIRTVDGKIVQSINLRYPAEINQEDIIRWVEETAAGYGWVKESLKHNPGYRIDPEDSRIQRMTEICNEVWERKFETYSMSGGTYARKLPRAVAYGPGIRDQKKPGWPNGGRGHQPNECVCIDNMMRAVEIYARVLIELDEIVE